METTATNPPQKKSNKQLTPDDGRQRVIIEHVGPHVEDGKYPAKRVVGEKLEAYADVYGDGHDHVRATLLYRKQGQKKWQRVFMKPGINDRWTGAFTPEEKGFYEFTVRGYVDHFETWQYGLRKKFGANQPVAVELLIGVEMMEESVKNADKEDKKFLKEAIKVLKAADDENATNAVSWALGDQTDRGDGTLLRLRHRHYLSQGVPGGSGAQKGLVQHLVRILPPLGGARTGQARHLQRCRATAAPRTKKWVSTCSTFRPSTQSARKTARDSTTP